jgi:hypothetical protein
MAMVVTGSGSRIGLQVTWMIEIIRRAGVGALTIPPYGTRRHEREIDKSSLPIFTAAGEAEE